MENNEAFLGRGWGFPPQFFSGGARVEMVSAEVDIQQSLYILLTTAIKERVMFPDYGCDLSNYVFEEIGQSLINAIEGSIFDAILKNEARVKTENIHIERAVDETGILLIGIEYTIMATNNRYNMVYPFYINEATR
ncbi:GPW/gp25 family protein [Mucilaginibacter phyllosphaerae]|uniref:IraD/Gp25-like domain-containing protein n=2 Tax=Mucilaginibacter phyllosphaerae TaxID=1812349 RepID=A0A4Y8ACC4_9SPHI|nr:GPW/gp25 family protein [Mucilaginibacter phyllosphaerae]MBB3969164.1 hypothetical protein [Mucilaginibacter phyllosphaerae]TEW66145.1 hypothetical protein E2R65_12950 [Mucilaginibacter phyllosphaerae]GGH06727.1 baseplate protein [Mucilaginibacter phyllosphaerae]